MSVARGGTGVQSSLGYFSSEVTPRWIGSGDGWFIGSRRTSRYFRTSAPGRQPWRALGLVSRLRCHHFSCNSGRGCFQTEFGRSSLFHWNDLSAPFPTVWIRLPLLSAVVVFRLADSDSFLAGFQTRGLLHPWNSGGGPGCQERDWKLDLQQPICQCVKDSWTGLRVTLSVGTQTAVKYSDKLCWAGSPWRDSPF